MKKKYSFAIILQLNFREMRKSSSKNNIIWSLRGCNDSKPPPPNYIKGLHYAYILNFSFLAQFEEKIEEKPAFFQGQEGETPHISPLLIDLVGCFLEILYNISLSFNLFKKI